MPAPRRAISASLVILLGSVVIAACKGDATAPTKPPGTGFGAEQFALIPAGSFQMGSTYRYPDEQPVHTVTITRAFYLQKTEVTQAQWRSVMNSNPSCFGECGETCPVECVDWDDVQAFLERLNEQDPGWSYRLPTEAEWEYAARANATGEWAGSGVLDEMGWYKGNSENRSWPVAQKPANAWGLYDVHGNVWEWVEDWHSYTYYAESPVVDPVGPDTGQFRVMRGGSWRSLVDETRLACRFSGWPWDKGPNLGFRVARTKRGK